MKRLFVFDLDNTFYDYEHSHSSGLKKVFESQNIYQSYQDFISAYHEVKTKVHKIMINNPSKHSKLVYFKNDIEYWINEYDAETYLIDNSNKKLKQNRSFFEGNLDSAVYKIFNQDF